jgi:hypothetical protein
MTKKSADPMKTKGVRMSDEQWLLCIEKSQELGKESPSEFVREAIDFYMEWLNLDQKKKFLTPELESVMRAMVHDSEDRISRLLFKNAVELNLQAPSATIVKQPVNVAAVSGKPIQFRVEATGTNLTYQWHRSNDNGATWVLTYMDGYNTDTLHFNATNARAALYMCKITDGSGKIVWTNVVKLQILSAELQILSQPENVTCANGATATFHVEAKGDSLKYQWYSSADGGATWTLSYMDGYNTDTFSFTVNNARASRLYKCVITDAGGNTVETNAVSVTIG